MSERVADGSLFTHQVMEILGNNLANDEGVSDGTRARILQAVERRLLGVETEVRKEQVGKTFQVKALRGLLLVMGVGCGLVLWRVSQVKPVALAQAYGILLDRQEVNARAGARALDVALEQITAWIRSAQDDADSTPADRGIRVENLTKIGSYLSEHRQMFWDVAEGCAKTERPKRISDSTYVDDPFTHMKLPLNRGKGGALDQDALNNFLSNDKRFAFFLAMAKLHSQRGAKAIGVSPRDWAGAVDSDSVKDVMKSLGIRADVLKPAGAVPQKN